MTFEMRRGADYRRHIPKMGESPELDNDQRAIVVAYDGPVRLPPHTGGVPQVDPSTGKIVTYPPDDGIESGVFCVLQGGEPNWYYDVDPTGMTPVLTDAPSASPS